MSLYKKTSANALIKTGFGRLMGLFCTASSSGIVQLVDGITSNDDAADKATGVLTVSGAIVPATHATNVLTSDATVPSDGEVVVIGAITYRWKDTLAQAYDVKIELLAADCLANLKKAINGTGTAGVEYFAGTVAHTLVVANEIAATTLQVWSRTVGTANNTLATTETSAHLSWADTTLGGGTGASNPGVAATAATVLVNGRTYTFVTELSETSGAAAVIDQVLHGGSTAIALDNFKLAITAGATAGTNYSTGTVVNADVTATTNTDTAQTLEALVAGAAGNNITTTETLTNGSFGAATLTGGLDANIEIIDEFPVVAGTPYPFTVKEGLDFNNGLYFRLISGTATVTVEYE